MIVHRLPDDIEQYLIDGWRFRATLALMERRRITLKEARKQIGRWLVAQGPADPRIVSLSLVLVPPGKQ